MGWWQDERLESRYERLSSKRLDELAVADNYGRKLTHRDLLQVAKRITSRAVKTTVSVKAIEYS